MVVLAVREEEDVVEGEVEEVEWPVKVSFNLQELLLVVLSASIYTCAKYACLSERSGASSDCGLCIVLLPTHSRNYR